MRRWVCLIALLAGFARDDFARVARVRDPIPIERRLHDVERADGPGLPLEAWWTPA